MGKTLDFIQIYYDNAQIKELYPFAIPYKNESLSVYFENDIIKDVVPKSSADLISVCSWRLRKKREDRSMQLRGDVELNEEKILNAEFDVARLTPNSPSHKCLVLSSQWHGLAWDNALKALKKFIKVPEEIRIPIYENHFIATKEVYHEYVSTCLIPCIEFIKCDPVFDHPSNYAKRKTESERKRIKELLNLDDWPIAPFILERIFSIWINDKNLKVINL